MIIHRPPFIIHHFNSLSSTNDQLKAMAAAPEFTCVVADEQTAGRGRRARTWYSAPGDGLYLSILFLPRSDSSSRLPLTGLLAAVAVAETLIERGVAGVDIKWPNDALAGGRKISGVLAEAVSAGPESLRLVLGVGVNLNHRSFPPELSESATSLAIETGERVIVEEFRDRLLEKIAQWYELWRRGASASIIDRWSGLSTYARGKQVMVMIEDEKLTGVTDGLTETGALRIVTDDGAVRTILAGEVTKLRTGADLSLRHSSA
ncbi:MAG TPA: biotin--[acetyl-CoA-carboxylase] ligase [Blastocatellia bacterium]|nr:biotin--[acetyl-CoA-carboxylase] ligase [Blastocatellia bacterium]